MKDRKKYWYRIHIEECVLCGAGETTRERVYCDDEPRPEKDEDRYVFHQYACDWHFL